MRELSIIIVSYKTRDLLYRCIKECQMAADGLNYEIIVVDNDSGDGSFEMVRDCFAEVKVIQSGANLGFAAANNLGYKKAEGDFILLLNSDAFIQGDGLKQALEKIKTDIHIGVIGAKLEGENGEWQPSARLFPGIIYDLIGMTGLAHKYPTSRLFGRPDMTYRDQNEEFECEWVPGAFSLIRKKALQDTIFDEAFFLYYEEVDMCLRLKRKGWKILYYPEVRVIHLGGASTINFSDKLISKSGKQMTLWSYQSKYLFYRKNYGFLTALASLTVEYIWNWARILKNYEKDNAEITRMILNAMSMAWKNTRHGSLSPERPWGTEM